MRLGEEKKRIESSAQKDYGGYSDRQLLDLMKRAAQDMGFASKFKDKTGSPDSAEYISEGSKYRAKITESQFNGSVRDMNKFTSQLGEQPGLAGLDMNQLMRSGAYSSLFDLSRNKPSVFNQILQGKYNDVTQLEYGIKQAFSPESQVLATPSNPGTPTPPPLPETHNKNSSGSRFTQSEMTAEQKQLFQDVRDSKSNIFACLPETNRRLVEMIIGQKYDRMVKSGKIQEGDPVSLISKDGDVFLVKRNAAGAYDIKDDTWGRTERAVFGGQKIAEGTLGRNGEDGHRGNYDISQLTNGPLSLINEKHPQHEQYEQWRRDSSLQHSFVPSVQQQSSTRPQQSTAAEPSEILKVGFNSDGRSNFLARHPDMLERLSGFTKMELGNEVESIIYRDGVKGLGITQDIFKQLVEKLFDSSGGKTFSVSTALDGLPSLSQRIDGMEALAAQTMRINFETGDLMNPSQDSRGIQEATQQSPNPTKIIQTKLEI